MWVRYQIPKKSNKIKKRKEEKKKFPFHLSTHLYIASLSCFPVHTRVIYSRHTDFGLKERFYVFVSTEQVKSQSAMFLCNWCADLQLITECSYQRIPPDGDKGGLQACDCPALKKKEDKGLLVRVLSTEIANLQYP